MHFDVTFTPDRDRAPELPMGWALGVRKVIVRVSADDAEQAVERARAALPELRGKAWPVLQVHVDRLWT